MAGNVVNWEGARIIAKHGATLIRVGVGSGAVCTTRLVTGHGLPQLSAIESCAEIKDDFPDVAIIADGGIRNSGDIVKALAIGADLVMIGSLLAGTIESPGEVIEEDGRLFKHYQGMASANARAGWFDQSKTASPVEGISTKVPYLNKSAVSVVNELCQSVKVGLSYSGAKDIQELRIKAHWRRVTAAGYIEGTPHGKRI
jgi:IMP dehydrogenase